MARKKQIYHEGHEAHEEKIAELSDVTLQVLQ